MAIDVNDLIRQREESASIAYQKFVLLTSTNLNSLFCFFENKDAPYYHLRLKQNFNGKSLYIPCGNKKMVLKTFELIKNHNEYDKYSKAFFIDRDFDAPIKNQFQEIYETPCYSIENLYCFTESFTEFIRTDLQIEEDDPSYTQIIERYISLREKYVNGILLFNSWYKLQKQKRIELRQELKVRLEDIFPNEFYTFTIQDIIFNYTQDSIEKKYPEHLPYSSIELEKTLDELQNENLILTLRGKYMFSFLTNFIRKLVEDGADPNKRFLLNKKIKYNMDNSSALSLLTTFAKTPQCLIDFIIKYN